MKVTIKKILEAAEAVASNMGFDDPEIAFWQCNIFSNAVVKTARLFDLYDLDIILVNAEWQTASGDVEAGDIHKHVLIKYKNKYYDFTIRQINEYASFPYVSQRLPRYYENLGEIDIEDLGDMDKEIIDQIVSILDPSITVKSNPHRKLNPKKRFGIIGKPPKHSKLIQESKIRPDGPDVTIRQINKNVYHVLFDDQRIDMIFNDKAVASSMNIAKGWYIASEKLSKKYSSLNKALEGLPYSYNKNIVKGDIK